jgi:beta-glucosidase
VTRHYQVLVLGIDKSIEREGTDRTDTALPALQESFANQVLALNKPTVLVLTNGGALAIDRLASARVPAANTSSGAPLEAPYAIVEAFNPAAYGGKAIGDALFGKPWANKWY